MRATSRPARATCEAELAEAEASLQRARLRIAGSSETAQLPLAPVIDLLGSAALIQLDPLTGEPLPGGFRGTLPWLPTSVDGSLQPDFAPSRSDTPAPLMLRQYPLVLDFDPDASGIQWPPAPRRRPRVVPCADPRGAQRAPRPSPGPLERTARRSSAPRAGLGRAARRSRTTGRPFAWRYHRAASLGYRAAHDDSNW